MRPYRLIFIFLSVTLTGYSTHAEMRRSTAVHLSIRLCSFLEFHEPMANKPLFLAFRVL